MMNVGRRDFCFVVVLIKLCIYTRIFFCVYTRVFFSQ